MSQENIDIKFMPANKKVKRISFSKNLMLQELLSDGSTRIFEEKIDDGNCSLFSMELDSINESDSIFNKTVYDTHAMELSLSTTCSPTLPPKASPVVARSICAPTSPSSPSPISALMSPSLPPPISEPISPSPHPPISEPMPLSPHPPISEPISPSSPSPISEPISPSPHPPLSEPISEPMPTSPPPPLSEPISEPISPSPPPQTPPSFSLRKSTTPISPSLPPSISEPISPSPPPPPQTPSPSFSMRKSTTPISPSLSAPISAPISPSLSPSAMQPDIGDTFYDSILIYIDEKSVLQLSCDDSTPEQSMIQYCHSTTFAADLLADDSIEQEEEESMNNTLNFIDNRAPSPVRKTLNSTAIDTRLWSFITEINEEYALLSFLQGNFQVLMKYDLQDEDNLEVIITEISFQSLIDQKIKEKGWTPISGQVINLLTKPRDAKLIKVIKKLAESHFEKFKHDIQTPAMLNEIMKKLCKIFNHMEALTVELAELTLRHEWKIVNADLNSFEIALETYGLRYSLWLVLSLDLETYPDYHCKVKFGVHKADLKLYPYHLLYRAAKNISPGGTDYLRAIVRATKSFIHDYRLKKNSRKSVRISFARKRTIM